jgi:phosphoenolpyruvate carboxylase
VNIFLQAIDRLGKDVDYYAVDLSLPELERTFSEIPTGKSIIDTPILPNVPEERSMVHP